jgi:hypothetical protein
MFCHLTVTKAVRATIREAPSSARETPTSSARETPTSLVNSMRFEMVFKSSSYCDCLVRIC